MDPVTSAATAIGTAVTFEKAGGKELVLKLLGPTADYLGQSTKYLAERGGNNVNRVFKFALDKLGQTIEKPGSIPPRVLKNIINEASVCENELMAEYLGGILAGSRREEIYNDRASCFVNLIGSMSILQLRAHYILYWVVRKIFVGETEVNVGDGNQRSNLRTFIPDESLLAALGSGANYSDVDHILNGFGSMRLVDYEVLCYGSKEFISTSFPKASGRGLVFQPSPLGIELFLWAHGMSNCNIREFLDPEMEFKFATDVVIPDGYCKVMDN